MKDHILITTCTFLIGITVAANWDASPIYSEISNWINVHMWAYRRAGGMIVNDAGEAYVAGWTKSDNFPTTTGAYQTIRRDNGRTDKHF